MASIEDTQSFDEYGLLRTPDGNITLFRAIEDHTALDTPNNRRYSRVRTLFHGIDGIYAGNTPESVSMYKMPALMKVELGDSVEVEDMRHINNARWAGRHALNLLSDHTMEKNNKLSLVRMTPPVSFISRRYVHKSGAQTIEPSWVIVPPQIFANALKEVVNKV